MNRPYRLEIYVADDEHPIQTFESDMPFGAIQRGDYIFADTWDHVEPSWRVGDRRPRMVVMMVEHRFWKDPERNARHQVAVTVLPEPEHMKRMA